MIWAYDFACPARGAMIQAEMRAQGPASGIVQHAGRVIGACHGWPRSPPPQTSTSTCSIVLISQNCIANNIFQEWGCGGGGGGGGGVYKAPPVRVEM